MPQKVVGCEFEIAQFNSSRLPKTGLRSVIRERIGKLRLVLFKQSFDFAVSGIPSVLHERIDRNWSARDLSSHVQLAICIPILFWGNGNIGHSHLECQLSTQFRCQDFTDQNVERWRLPQVFHLFQRPRQFIFREFLDDLVLEEFRDQSWADTHAEFIGFKAQQFAQQN